MAVRNAVPSLFSSILRGWGQAMLVAALLIPGAADAADAGRADIVTTANMDIRNFRIITPPSFSFDGGGSVYEEEDGVVDIVSSSAGA